MNKVLIDRELLSVASLHLEYSGYTETGKKLRALLDSSSGTPAMPVKAYYHEWTDLEGVRTRSVGLEVRKQFNDAPLVLEADALAQIACLEGEIAKRDERIVEMQEKLAADDDANLNLRGLLQRGAFALGLDPENTSWFEVIGELEKQSAELSALKAQEPVAEIALSDDGYKIGLLGALRNHRLPIGTKLYAAPVSEAKAHGNYAPDSVVWIDAHHVIEGNNPSFIKDVALVSAERTSETQIPLASLAAAQAAPSHGEQVRVVPVEPTEAMRKAAQDKLASEGLIVTDWLIHTAYSAMLAAAPAAPAADAGIVDMYRHLQKVTPYRFKKIQDASISDGGDVMYFHKDRFDAALLADMAAHCAAKGVV